MEAFFRVYLDRFPVGPQSKRRILEVGSQSYEGQASYRSLIDAEVCDYTGLDLSMGSNVDIVPAMPFVWNELPDACFDVCISGQTFEHNPFFWVTASEMARVLVPGGWLCLIAPGAGPVHRYPMDCWRFYPDAWSALCALVGLELVETYWEPDSAAPLVQGGEWRDALLIARKPLVESGSFAGAAERRAQLTAPFQSGFGHFEPVSYRPGPAIEDYLAVVDSGKRRTRLKYLRQKVARRIHPNSARLFKPPEADDGDGSTA
jgi:SAM-dependent methyltransferase